MDWARVAAGVGAAVLDWARAGVWNQRVKGLKKVGNRWEWFAGGRRGAALPSKYPALPAG